MQIRSDSFRADAAIPPRCAFGKHHPTNHVELSENRNPHLAWSDVPAGTKSLALVCVDSDVPNKPDDVNQEGKRVPASLPRVDFYHWILVDIPPSRSSLAEAELGSAIVPKGKSGPQAAGGMRQGVNNYSQWFAGDADMAGDYFGYDGPCPPWNDEIVHHYHFKLFALDLDRCPVDGKFDGPAVLAAIEGHVLAQASITGTYAINPDAK